MPQIKIPRETRIAKLHEISKLKMVETRLLELAVKYLVKATINFNPIIIQTLKEYERFSGGRELEIQTLLDPFKSQLLELLKELETNLQSNQEEEIINFFNNLEY